MAHYSYNPEAKFGEPHHKTTMRELFEAMQKVDPTSPAWDSPIDVLDGEGLTAYNFTIEDVTEDCDGSCDNPTCIAAIDTADAKAAKVYHDTGLLPPGYTDEGLHFMPTFWINHGGTRY